MKINEIQTDQVKSDANKVIDLVKSGQGIDVAVNTYKNIHSGKLDYDAAYSLAIDDGGGKASQQRKDSENRAKAQKAVDDQAKKQQTVAKDKAQRLKSKGTFKKDDDASRKQKAQTIFLRDSWATETENQVPNTENHVPPGLSLIHI